MLNPFKNPFNKTQETQENQKKSWFINFFNRNKGNNKQQEIPKNNDKQQEIPKNNDKEVFSLNPDKFEKGICYAYTVDPIHIYIDSKIKYFTTKKLNYLGKFESYRLNGRGRDEPVKYYFTKDNDEIIEIDNYTDDLKRRYFKEVPCQALDTTSGGKLKRSRKNKKSKNTRRKSIRRRRRH
jgi:hypothetical protein